MHKPLTLGRARPALRLAFAAAAAWLALCGAAFAESGPDASQVATESGLVQGQALADGMVVFRGIPYAAPPVADLRWRPPQPAPVWRDVRQATQFAPACMQPLPPRGDLYSDDP